MSYLKHKHILLGVTGGIAAYKSADLTRRLREAGAIVRVVMTVHAKEFITPLTMQAVSGFPVHEDLFDLNAEAAMGHIELARWADIVLVAPATADFMAKLLQGAAADLLTTLCLAAKAPIVLAPAMNQAMWENSATQANVKALQHRGIYFFGPGRGEQACGEIGPGRMWEPLQILQHLNDLLGLANKLSGKRVIITAGPTREAIDPVRYISNKSSGKMGYALAEVAIQAGAEVTLISGPTSLSPPARAMCIDVISAQDMLEAVMQRIKSCDIFIGVAAVADYRCTVVSAQKLAKTQHELRLTFEPTPDIIRWVAELPARPLVIGFAAETENVLPNARAKLVNKKLDMIFANLVGDGVGMESDENAVTALWKDRSQVFQAMTKQNLARNLINLISEALL